MLIHRDELAERARRQAIEHERVGRLVAGTIGKTLCAPSSPANIVTDDALRLVLAASSVLPAMSASVCAKKLESRMGWCSPTGFCGHQRLRLREEVGRDELGALVDQLVERVLPVGAGLAPDDRPRRARDLVAAARDALAVGLHVALLKVGGEAVHVLIVRQDRVRLAP